jgi:hypothetical protein
MDEDRISGTARLPLAALARRHAADLFPHLTPAQLASLRDGTPMPSDLDQAEPADSGQPETVSCVLLASRLHARTREPQLARAALRAFVSQTYPRKELVIVNTTGVPVVTDPRLDVAEIHAPPELRGRVGLLRNLGLDRASGSWVRPCWDDDDYYNPNLLSYQMACRRPGKALLLGSQVRVDPAGGIAFHFRPEQGVVNTMLVPSTVRRFEDMPDCEDDVFWSDWFDRTVVAPNYEFPENIYSVAVWHGSNLLDREVFMDRHVPGEVAGWQGLSTAEETYLRKLLLNSNYKPAGGQS